nr:reverse transcriptase domain-containing protein [Tanacetum cinerariifolium]
MFDRLIGEIQGFTQHSHESLVEDWLRMKDLLHSCHGHGLGRGTIIQIFYHGLDDATQAIINAEDMKAKPLRKKLLLLRKGCAMDATNVKDLTRHQSVMINRWENPKKKLTISTKDIKEENIEETTTPTKRKNRLFLSQINPINHLSRRTSKKIPYSQRLRNEKMEEHYAKFIDMIKEIIINVPLVDVLAGMPNYRKFLKDFVSNKNWLRMKDLLHSCHGHGLGRGTIIQIFYHGLDDATQAIINAEDLTRHQSVMINRWENPTKKLTISTKDIKEENIEETTTPDIENMTMSEYLEYEAAKERKLWDDVRSRRSPTHYEEADFSSSHRNKNKKDSDFDKILDDLFRNRADNLKRMGQDIVQDSIYKQDVHLEKDRQFLTPNVHDVMDNIIQPLIPKTIHTPPPDEDYVAPANKSILDDLLEEFRDKILNVTMVDKGVECSPTKDLEELERLLAGNNSEEMKFEVTLTRNYMVDTHGVALGSFFATGRNFKFELVRYYAKDDDGIFVIMNIARRSRL